MKDIAGGNVMVEDRLDTICNDIKNKLDGLIETLAQEHKLMITISEHEHAALEILKTLY